MTSLSEDILDAVEEIGPLAWCEVRGFFSEVCDAVADVEDVFNRPFFGLYATPDTLVSSTRATFARDLWDDWEGR